MNDLFSLKLEVNRLRNELQFAQNFNELLENYRNLTKNCVNNCDNCSKNEEMVNKFHYLEITYNKHLDFAKERDLNALNNKLNNELNANNNNNNNNSDKNRETFEMMCEPLLYDSEEDSEDSEDSDLDMTWNKSRPNYKNYWSQSKPKRAVRNRNTGWDKNRKLYKCDSCDYTHRKLPNLESHKNKVHLQIRPFKCDKCDKDFTGKPVLDKHKRKVHNESDSVYHHCDWNGCEFKTKYWNNLKEHKLRHTGDRTFKCCWPGCEKSFYNNKELTQHMTSHEDNKDFRCDWPGCGACFKRAVYLGRHKLLHTSPDTAHPCVWPGCGKSFNTKKKLGKHMAVHKKTVSPMPGNSVSRPVGRPVTLQNMAPPIPQQQSQPQHPPQQQTPPQALTPDSQTAKSPQHPFDLSQRGLPFIPPQMSMRWPNIHNIPNFHNKQMF